MRLTYLAPVVMTIVVWLFAIFTPFKAKSPELENAILLAVTLFAICCTQTIWFTWIVLELTKP